MNKIQPRRICLFAGYDKDGVIQEYVLYYLKALSQIADVYYLADCNMPEQELGKLNGIVKKSWSFRHGKYDFGSWQELTQLVGWDEIAKYDQLIFANDSCYGPFFPFEDVFQRMEETGVDFWGLTQSQHIRYHLQSYFLVFNHEVIMNKDFRAFMANIEHKKEFMDIVRSYEIGLTQLLEESGFKPGAAFFKEGSRKNLALYPNKLLNYYHCPLIKAKCFLPEFNHLKDWYPSLKQTIQKKTNYDWNLIEQHLASKKNNLLLNSLLLCFQHPLLKWIYKTKTKNGIKTVKLFLITVSKKRN